VEVSEPAARLALEWHQINVRVGDVADEPRDGFFDAVTAIGLLEHVTDPQTLLQQMRRLLVPNGVMFVYTPVWGTYDRVASTLARLTTGRMTRLIDRRINRAHLQIFPKRTIVDTLRQQGWEVIRCEAVCEYNLPVKHYLQSIGVTNRPVQALAARFLKTLIDHRAFFRNNLRLLARKTSHEQAQ
jgi:2-polyprenyl-3-methyl-5-hydroxy-6-metoxy-1,4-benzoquinol methylase